MTTAIPLLTLPGFYLRPIEPGDAEVWAHYAALPTVKQYTSSTVESAADIAPLIARSQSGEVTAPIYFAICRESDARLVATAGFHTVSAINRTAEITYDVDPAYWGRGIASASCAATVSWGFTIRKFVRIQATVLEGNLGSRRVLEKCHFAYEGTMRNFRMVRGEPRDYLLYAALPT